MLYQLRAPEDSNSYWVILRVTASVWGTAAADDPVATTVTWTLVGDAAGA
jgi:hypothetical protein